MMQDVRLGRAITLDNVEPVIVAVTGSILRNGSALLGLVGIKNKDRPWFCIRSAYVL